MVSYVFIAIIWINHHYLMRFVGTPTLGWYGLTSSIIAYNVFERDVLAQADATQMSECKRHTARRRSLVVLAIFTTAMLIAFVAPRVGFGLICGGLILHIWPEVAGGKMKAQ